MQRTTTGSLWLFRAFDIDVHVHWTWFLVAALQIALPIAAALFLADVALALVSRAAPRIDVLVLGLGTKALIILLITGLTLPLIPHALQLLIERAAHLEILSGG
jgi:flagellar biosynthetic protein FliR